MPTIRQSLVASLTKFYPFYSGCASFANNSLIIKLAGASNERVWSAVPGGEVLASLNDYNGRAAFYVGERDRKLTWICAQIVKPGDTVLDIGANIGAVTVWLSKLVGDRGQVHSFEPNPELQSILETTFARNKMSNTRLHPIALGAEEGSLELRIPQNHPGMGSLVRNRETGNCDVVEVLVRRLSKIADEQGIKSIKLIKIDVEGFEAEVFKGGREVLLKTRPEAIIFELNEKLQGKASEQPAIKILRDFGYKFFSIPKCLVRMHLESFDPDRSNQLIGHDFLAVPEESYQKIAKLVNASV
ncbi:FkbM family methyltransferase [Calothrix sp. CCY 0018]|uniref:FkbM family methyltransferase n=1 Tax=Calothrix sp. CCY 0018 TaxID=3103864 RepID=UPI0039C6F730